MASNCFRCCSIVPPHVLKYIATHGNASERSKFIAAKTLNHVSGIHQARVNLLSHPETHGSDGGAPDGATGGRRPHNIIPSYTYQAIIDSEDASAEAKERARKHLASVGQLKDAKVGGQSQQQTVIKTTTKHLNRVMYDAHQTDQLPGTKLWMEGYTPKASDEQSAREVYVQFKQVFDFYFDVFGRDSIDNKGMSLIGSVSYDDDNGATPGYDNAFWDGKQMAFGDGDGELFGSFTKNLDVTGHELTHGVTEKTANLEYEYQAGALNESISDVFGSMVKQYFGPNGKQTAKEADWLIGEGLWLVDNARALRDMANPGTAYNNPKIGKDPQPASMDDFLESSNDENGDWGGVHTNSGIPNRAFYLVATSIGTYSWDVAGKIWYASLTDPALKNINTKTAFKTFADLTVKHAQEIGGADAVAAVKKAWTTVKVYPAHA